MALKNKSKNVLHCRNTVFQETTCNVRSLWIPPENIKAQNQYITYTHDAIVNIQAKWVWFICHNALNKRINYKYITLLAQFGLVVLKTKQHSLFYIHIYVIYMYIVILVNTPGGCHLIYL